MTITIQIMGTVPRGQAVLRSGAKAGDDIYVSGCLGGAAYALSLLNKPANEIPEECLNRLLRPQPRLEFITLLRQYATAAIDISDGLSADLYHILKASIVGAEVELNKIPVCNGLRNLDEQSRYQFALSGGDDYELCFTAPAKFREQLIQELQETDLDCSCIGKITASDSLHWMMADKKELQLSSSAYQHF